MSKFTEAFENKGIERQYNATNPKVAQRAFATSCDICCTRGMHLNCSKCGISTAHNTVMTILFNERGA